MSGHKHSVQVNGWAKTCRNIGYALRKRIWVFGDGSFRLKCKDIRSNGHPLFCYQLCLNRTIFSWLPEPTIRHAS